MTVPQDYVNASRDFDRFMDDLMDISMLPTHHSAYAVLRAVLHVFRDHLTVEQGLRFAETLPAVLRAIFVENWHPHGNPPPFPDWRSLIAEVKADRADHNLAGESSIRDVAQALRRNVAMGDLERVLRSLPPEAQRYWLD
jgi:uncharacterized protein (DUF2267 family)